MEQFSQVLNDLLMEIYHNVLRLEEVTLKRDARLQLSIAEMHLIECVGKASDSGCTVSELADSLDITRPSATVAVNKMEKKGYVTKIASKSDGRVVHVHLTREGKKVDAYHRYYHRNMIRELSKSFSEEEKRCLMEAVRKLNNFFKNSIGEKNEL